MTHYTPKQNHDKQAPDYARTNGQTKHAHVVGLDMRV